MSKDTPIRNILIIGSSDDLQYVANMCGQFVSEQKRLPINIRTTGEIRRQLQKVYFTQVGFESMATTCKTKMRRPWNKSKVQIQKKCITNLADSLHEKCAKTVDEIAIWFYNGNACGELHCMKIAPQVKNSGEENEVLAA